MSANWSHLRIEVQRAEGARGREGRWTDVRIQRGRDTEKGDRLARQTDELTLVLASYRTQNHEFEYFKWTYCAARGTRLKVMRQPGWERVWGERTHVYGQCVPLLSI